MKLIYWHFMKYCIKYDTLNTNQRNFFLVKYKPVSLCFIQIQPEILSEYTHALVLHSLLLKLV